MTNTLREVSWSARAIPAVGASTAITVFTVAGAVQSHVRRWS